MNLIFAMLRICILYVTRPKKTPHVSARYLQDLDIKREKLRKVTEKVK